MVGKWGQRGENGCEVEGRAALKGAELDDKAGPQLHKEFLIQPHVAWDLPHVTESEQGDICIERGRDVVAAVERGRGCLQPLFSAPLQASRPSSTCPATRRRCSTWRRSGTQQCSRGQKDSGKECRAPAMEISRDFSGLEVRVDVGPHVERRAAARRRTVHALRHQRVPTPQLEGWHLPRNAAAQLTRRSAGLSSGRSLRQSREW